MSFIEKIESEFALIEGGMNGQKDGSVFKIRKEALRAFQKLGIPSNRHEEWKYTPIKAAIEDKLPFPHEPGFGAVPSFQVREAHQIKGIKGTRLVFRNGSFSASDSSYIEEDGIVVIPLQAAFKSRRELIGQYFGKLIDNETDHFAALNTAFTSDGALVIIGKNKTAQHPIFIIHLYDSPHHFSQSRNLIIAEEGSVVSLIEDFQNLSAESFYNHVTEVFAEQNSSVNISRVQTETANATGIHGLEADVARDAKFTCTTVCFEGKLMRNNSNVKLSGENAEAHLNGLYFAGADSLVDNHLLVDHRVPNCASNQLYKGIIDGNGVGVFNGKIFVRKDAQKTNAFQSSKAILLSDEASVNSKPQLEIFADDVKCSHGAAIGQLNKNELFYLAARGIDEDDAKAILTFAFANEVISGIEHGELKDYLSDKLRVRLNLHI